MLSQLVLCLPAAVLDFVADFGEVQFSPSDTQQQVTMTIVDDDLLEDLETLRLSLTPGQGSTTNQNSSAMPVILDNDEVSVQFDVVSCALTASEGDAAVELVVTRVGLSSIPVQVVVQTQDGTATGNIHTYAIDTTLLVYVTMSFIYFPQLQKTTLWWLRLSTSPPLPSAAQ